LRKSWCRGGMCGDTREKKVGDLGGGKAGATTAANHPQNRGETSRGDWAEHHFRSQARARSKGKKVPRKLPSKK